MKPVQFVKILSNIRAADDMLGEALTAVACHVLEQWHKHGNRTPHMQLMLAIDGGTDEHGLFGDKGSTLRGVSKGVATLFAGLRRLPKRDETTDTDEAALHAVESGMATRAELRAEAKAKREANATAKARAAAEAEEVKAEPVKLMLIDAAGAGIQLTAAEHAALAKTLQLLRDQDAIDAEIRVVEIVEEVPALAA